jgi:hypothetical protein
MTHKLLKTFSPFATGLMLLGMGLLSWQQVPLPGQDISALPPDPSRPAQWSRADNRPADDASPLAGRVTDTRSGRPLKGATVYHNGVPSKTGSDGAFKLTKADPLKPVFIKCPGYRRATLPLPTPNMEVGLKPQEVKGLYLTHFGIAYKPLRDGVLDLIRSTELNAVVIDVKGDRGFLSSNLDVALAREIGSNRLTTVKDIRSLIEQLHNEDVYVIGRIVAFKDDILAHARPELAIVDTRTKEPWIDNEHLAWVDPFRKEVWSYNISIAIEAAKAGFDEIQLDYVRFPTDGRLSSAKYSQPNTMEARVKTIDSFLENVQSALLPYNVYFSADIFGYTPWNYNDTDIGQKIENVADHVDYICLMVYPSGYHLGIPGYLKPVAHPYEVVYYTLEKARNRLAGKENQLRPWLQNFRDYAFDRRHYTGTEIMLQIEACKEASTSGYMLWDPSNKYKFTADAMSSLRDYMRQPATKPTRVQAGSQ